MSTLGDLLNARELPSLLTLKRGGEVKAPLDYEKRRKEIKKILSEEVYGYIPNKPLHIDVDKKIQNASFAAGKAVLSNITIKAQIDGGIINIPATSIIPKKDGCYPAFISLGGTSSVPNEFLPAEEITDRGYAIFHICPEETIPDGKSFPTENARLLTGKTRTKSSPGKLAMWAWMAMFMMDYTEKLPNIDKDRIAVIGHGKYGKAALLAGGYDERFKYIIANGSGCMGAALNRGKHGENVNIIASESPELFCKSFIKGGERVKKFEFDQHFLLGLCVPRSILIGCAEEDLWSDPESEFLSLVSVNDAYSIYEKRGLVHSGETPQARCVLSDGDASYHIRCGTNYLSREDWNIYMDFIDKSRGRVKN